MEGLELLKETSEEVVVKINGNKVDWLNDSWDFVTITKGPSHRVLFTYKDQSSRMVLWGDAVDDLIHRAAKKIVDFVQEECHILLEYTGQPLDCAYISYSEPFSSWELMLVGYGPFWTAHYYNKDAKHAEDMKICAERFLNIKKWSQTGDNEWRGVLYHL